jgi:hypothetical protein
MSELTEELYGAPMSENEEELLFEADETSINSYTYHEPEYANYWIPVSIVVILGLLIIGLGAMFFLEAF